MSILNGLRTYQNVNLVLEQRSELKLVSKTDSGMKSVPINLELIYSFIKSNMQRFNMLNSHMLVKLSILVAIQSISTFPVVLANSHMFVVMQSIMVSTEPVLSTVFTISLLNTMWPTISWV